ncbi:TetR family transcriptional regulator C-terminal domain-containing protein [Pseudodesulfovibrio sp.]|uniref:TetR family transcriptional regulator C-terminal domain-containing protein n=1 Tax=unclassified Pseudodesulfovibrio TaxID=2661612 RepID=UPI003AFFEFF1
MRDNTRQRILEAGAELIHRKGLNNTGINEVLQAAGVPKGSCCFDDEETFCVEIVDYFSRRFGEMARPIIEDKSLSPLKRLRKIFMVFHNHFKSHGYASSCPIGNLGQEMGDLKGSFRDKLAEYLNQQTDVVETLLSEAQHAADIEPDLDPRETAIFIIGAWHGAINRMKVIKNPEPLEIFYKLVFEAVLR